MSLMELELEITCVCHQAEIAKCCQTPEVAQIAQIKICRGSFSKCLTNLQSGLLSDYFRNTHKHQRSILHFMTAWASDWKVRYQSDNFRIQPQRVQPIHTAAFSPYSASYIVITIVITLNDSAGQLESNSLYPCSNDIREFKLHGDILNVLIFIIQMPVVILSEN